MVGEIFEQTGRSQYRVATSRGEVILDGMQLKLYLPPHDLNGKEPPLHFYTDSDFLVDSEKYIIEDIVGHTKVGRGKNRHIQWEVKYKVPACVGVYARHKRELAQIQCKTQNGLEVDGYTVHCV